MTHEAPLTLDDLVQSDPPPRRHGVGQPGLRQAFMAVIRTKPGVWFEYPRLTRSGGFGRVDGYEFTSRNVGDGQIRVWGRYTG